MTEFNTRPLGPVSDFVVERMPEALEKTREEQTEIGELVSTADTLISGLSTKELTVVLGNPAQSDLAGLDLKMLEAAIVHSKGVPPSNLVRLVDMFAQNNDQPGGITYEEIIIINPPDDKRTFTAGEVGKTERAFYEGHRRIEPHLDSAIATIRTTILFLAYQREGAIEAVTASLNDSHTDLVSLINFTHRIGDQNRTHFLAFSRPYLNSHPLRGTNGPSGAFTAGIPTLDLLVGGENLPSDYTNYLEENYVYFPRIGRRRMDEARLFISQGLTLSALSEGLGNPTLLYASVKKISDLIEGFRKAHYSTVTKQLPEALTGQVAGTGGEHDPGTFLRNRMKIRHIKERKHEQ